MIDEIVTECSKLPAGEQGQCLKRLAGELAECVDKNCNESQEWDKVFADHKKDIDTERATKSEQSTKCEAPCRAALLPQAEQCKAMEGSAADECKEKLRKFYGNCVTNHCTPSKNEL